MVYFVPHADCYKREDCSNLHITTFTCDNSSNCGVINFSKHQNNVAPTSNFRSSLFDSDLR